MRKVLFLIISIIIATQTSGYAFTDIRNSNQKNAVEELSEFSIINGYEDGTFKPDNSITRAEFTKIIVAMANLYQIVKNTNSFSDTTNHWASDYIEIAKEKGIINGVSDELFAPDDNVTYEQSVKMIVCALGYGEEAESKGGYPNGYIKTANELNILNKLDFVNTDYATRGNVAVMIKNALQVPYYSIGYSDGEMERFNTNKTLYEIHLNLLETKQTDEANIEVAVG